MGARLAGLARKVNLKDSHAISYSRRMCDKGAMTKSLARHKTARPKFTPIRHKPLT
jgi:hypothetical protein